MRTRRNGSSADSGSSSSSTRGCMISARASAMRCCCPPESCGGQPRGVVAHLHQVEELARAPMPLGLADPAHLEAEGDVVEAVEMREQRVVLEHHGRAARRRRQVGDVAAVDQQIALGDALVPGDHAQRRGLAAAAGAEQAAVAGLGHAQRDARRPQRWCRSAWSRRPARHRSAGPCILPVGRSRSAPRGPLAPPLHLQHEQQPDADEQERDGRRQRADGEQRRRRGAGDQRIDLERQRVAARRW